MGIELIRLTCNYMEKPIGLDTQEPCFSWIIKSSLRGIKQKAYRVKVASDFDKLEHGPADMWDSGWVESDRSVNVIYKGSNFVSDTKYYWSVSIIDNHSNEIMSSTPGSFTTALLNQSDWKSAFIGPKEIVNSSSKIRDTDKAVLLRNEYKINSKIKRARAYFSGLGWGELYINGAKVSDSVLDPAPTDYRFSVPYVIFDVTEKLKKGSNAIGIQLGNSWFSEYGWIYAYGLTPKAMLQINIEYEDGTTERLVTDTTWKTSSGPIMENRFWGGEYYDAREERDGWTSPGYNDENWEYSVIKNRCQGMMKAQEMPPIRVLNTIKPVLIKDADVCELNSLNRITVFDMQQLFGGWSKVHVRGERGEKIKICYSDRLDPEGFVDQSLQISGGPCDRYYTNAESKACTDFYILKGDPDGETYEPRFTFHPVQYVQVEYNFDKVQLISIEGRHTYQDLDFSSDFNCSNDLFNKIHKAVVRTLKNQSFGIPLDCLNREHWGWVDPASIAGTFYPRQYIPLFWKKWITDIRESQFANGAIPSLAPLYVQDFNNPDPIWGGSFIRLVWFFYQYYNDESVLFENYNSLKRLFEYHSLHIKDGILTEGAYGDHMIPGKSPGEEEFISSETSYEFLWTGWYFESARTLSRIAGIIGKNDEKEYFSSIADKTYKSINKKWFQEKEAIYDKGSQTSQYYALAAGFVPHEYRKSVLERAITDLQTKYHGNHHTGNTGTTAMIDALGNGNRADVLHNMINRTSYPGWGYMIDHGASTIWESWSTENGVGCELSMTMFTTVDGYFFNELAGIKGPGFFGDSLFCSQGFQTVVISPYIPEDMTFAKAEIQTVYGKIESGWEKKEDKTIFKLSIPGNSEALLIIPCNSETIISESGTTLWDKGTLINDIEGIHTVKYENGSLSVKSGSGQYLFEVLTKHLRPTIINK